MTKFWLILGIVLVIVGLIVFAGIMSAYNWDFTRLSTEQYETNTYDIKEKITGISINTNTADVVFVPTDDGTAKVVCYESVNLKHSVSVSEDTLNVTPVDQRKWYEYIGISFNTPKITVYMPKGEYASLSVKSSTGDVEIPDGFKFRNVDITESTGDVTSFATASGFVKIKTSTGDIKIENITASEIDFAVTTGKVTVTDVNCSGEINVKVSTGKAVLSDVKCENLTSSGSTGKLSLKDVIVSEKLSVKRSTGDVKLDRCDAGEVNITTDTGDIRGTLLSDKVFIAKSDTGKVNVPKTVVGGRCELTTDTGNIIIDIVK